MSPETLVTQAFFTVLIDDRMWLRSLPLNKMPSPSYPSLYGIHERTAAGGAPAKPPASSHRVQVGVPFKSAKQVDKSFDAVIIGSGPGGLAAAALLAEEGGMKVLVLEQHATAGGFTHVFKRRGFEFDVGVHYLGGRVAEPGTVENKMFSKVSHGSLEWEPLPRVYDRLLVNGAIYDCKAVRSWDEYVDHWCCYFPEERQALKKYVQRLQEACASRHAVWRQSLLKVDNATLPVEYVQYAGKTTRQVLQELGVTQTLAGVLTAQWFDYGLPPAQSNFVAHASNVEAYLTGGCFPKQGAASLAANMIRVIEASAGAVYVGAKVKRILIDKLGACGIMLETGETIEAPIIVSDAGASSTFNNLLPGRPKYFAREISECRDHIASLTLSCCHVALYVGIKSDSVSQFKDVGNLWVLPSYDHDMDVASATHTADAPFPVLFISSPSQKAHTYTQKHYPGKSTLELLAWVHPKHYHQWAGTMKNERGPSYGQMKKHQQKVLHALLQHYCPEVPLEPEYLDSSTPLSTKHYNNCVAGEIYGLGNTVERATSNILRSKTLIPNLFLTGQDSCVTSGGITGSVLTGYLTASCILGVDILAGL